MFPGPHAFRNDWVKRRLVTAPVMAPFSIMKVPLRVTPNRLNPANDEAEVFGEEGELGLLWEEE